MYEIIKINNFIILLNENKSLELCKVRVSIDNGFMDETKENSGIVHLTEHVLTESWKKCLHNGCSKYLSNWGIEMNAETHLDLLCYYLDGPKESINVMIDYITTIITDKYVKNSRIIKEKKAVENELMNTDILVTKLYNALYHILYTNEGLIHAEDIKLQIANLKNIDKKMIVDWINKNFCNNNTIFTVVGNFNKRKVIDLFKKKLPRRNSFCQICDKQIIRKDGINIKFLKEREMNENTKIMIALPFNFSDGNITNNYINFFELFVDNGMQSILFYYLREKMGLVYGIENEYVLYQNCGVYTITLSCKNSHTIKVIEKTFQILKMIKQGKFSQKKFNLIKKSFELNFLRLNKDMDYYTRYYSNQLMRTITNLNSNTKIHTPEENITIIKKLKKREFVTFLQSFLMFDNIKLVYQSKKQVSERKILDILENI